MSELSNDLQDRLLTWIIQQERAAQREIFLKHDPDFNQGVLNALVDVKCFVMTGGKLSEPTPHFPPQHFKNSTGTTSTK